nr:hypothetical protein [Tanacetum cinerariifolium]
NDFVFGFWLGKAFCEAAS